VAKAQTRKRNRRIQKQQKATLSSFVLASSASWCRYVGYLGGLVYLYLSNIEGRLAKGGGPSSLALTMVSCSEWQIMGVSSYSFICCPHCLKSDEVYLVGQIVIDEMLYCGQE